MINYYELLGVDIKAEAIVIRSAYEAMIQKYHSDKAVGQKQIDEYAEKTKLINEAYNVLFDEVKRKKYNEELSKNNKSEKTQGNDESNKNSDSSSKKQSSQSSDDWETVIKYFPDVDIYYNELKEISEVLAAEFRLYILNKKEFKKAKNFSEKLKKRFFDENFENSKECQDFGLWLLKNKKRELFLEFQKLFVLMSKSIDSKDLVYQFCKENNILYSENLEGEKKGNQESEKESRLYFKVLMLSLEFIFTNIYAIIIQSLPAIMIIVFINLILEVNPFHRGDIGFSKYILFITQIPIFISINRYIILNEKYNTTYIKSFLSMGAMWLVLIEIFNALFGYVSENFLLVDGESNYMSMIGFFSIIFVHLYLRFRLQQIKNRCAFDIYYINQINIKI